MSGFWPPVKSLKWKTAPLVRQGMNLAHVGRYFTDSQVPLWRKLLGLGAVAYAVMPIDVIPDFLPVIGWLDDIGVIALFTAAVVSDISKHAAARVSAQSGAKRTGNVQVIDSTARPLR